MTLDEDKIIRIPDVDFTPNPKGVGYVFFHKMLENGDNVAQIDGLTGEEDTFSALHKRCVRAAIVMRKKGLTANDFISLCTFNNLNNCVPIISATFLGIKVASVDPDLSLEDNKRLLKQVMPRMIFVTQESVEMVENIVEGLNSNIEIVVLGDTTRHTPFSEFLHPSDEEESFQPVEPRSIKDTVMVFFSSGTSGFPKGICHSHYSILGLAARARKLGSRQVIVLTSASPYWTVFGGFLVNSIMCGTARLIFPTFEASLFLEALSKYKVTYLFLSREQGLTICSLGRPSDLCLHSLTDICLGGGPLLKDQILKIKDMFPEVRVHLVYGQTEVFGVLTNFNALDPEAVKLLHRKPTSCGMGKPGVCYKIVNPETEEVLGPHQRGELRVKTRLQMSGYHNLDSSEAWDKDGWLKTGDLVYYDEDHCFYVVDRIKEMFKCKGWHVVPAVLESLLLTHPAVASAVVTGVPDDIDEYHPMAIVTLQESADAVTPEEIANYVEERVHDWQRLRRGVKIVAALPVTPSGKINRKKVKDMVLKGTL